MIIFIYIFNLHMNQSDGPFDKFLQFNMQKAHRKCLGPESLCVRSLFLIQKCGSYLSKMLLNLLASMLISAGAELPVFILIVAPTSTCYTLICRSRFGPLVVVVDCSLARWICVMTVTEALFTQQHFHQRKVFTLCFQKHSTFTQICVKTIYFQSFTQVRENDLICCVMHARPVFVGMQ